MSGRRDVSETRIPLRAFPGVAWFVVFVRRLARAQLESEHPTVAAGGKRISRLRQCADQLARDGREDQAAATQLRTLARGNQRRLLQAAAVVRSNGYVREELLTHRANELLQAAASGREVRPASAEQLAWFDQVEQFISGTPEDVYGRIRHRQPALVELEELTRRLAAKPEAAVIGSPGWLAVYQEVVSRLDLLLGPDAPVNDPLLRTLLVRDVARRYLLRITYGIG